MFSHVDSYTYWLEHPVRKNVMGSHDSLGGLNEQDKMLENQFVNSNPDSFFNIG